MKESADPPATVVTVKRILVPIDRSEYKEKIVGYAISLSKAWKAEMTVIHVLEPRHALPDGGETETKEQARVDESRRHAENLLDEVSILAKNQDMNINAIAAGSFTLNIKGQALEESGIVGDSIIYYAKNNNTDVIVIGTKGMSAVEEYFFGSVANKVIHEAHCPVFAIR
ncbi:MAG TPA: universal stress protein [Candidatus Bathyarchaeia archaeon]|nr:universal stress protein [Candidatus Bathyarchaeia archaeon]